MKTTVRILVITCCIYGFTLQSQAEASTRINVAPLGIDASLTHSGDVITLDGKLQSTILGVPVKLKLNNLKLQKHRNGDFGLIYKDKLGPFGGKLVFYIKPKGLGRFQYLFRVEAITGIKRIYLPGPSHHQYAKGHVYLQKKNKATELPVNPHIPRAHTHGMVQIVNPTSNPVTYLVQWGRVGETNKLEKFTIPPGGTRSHWAVAGQYPWLNIRFDSSFLEGSQFTSDRLTPINVNGNPQMMTNQGAVYKFNTSGQGLNLIAQRGSILKGWLYP